MLRRFFFGSAAGLALAVGQISRALAVPGSGPQLKVTKYLTAFLSDGKYRLFYVTLAGNHAATMQFLSDYQDVLWPEWRQNEGVRKKIEAHEKYILEKGKGLAIPAHTDRHLAALEHALRMASVRGFTLSVVTSPDGKEEDGMLQRPMYPGPEKPQPHSENPWPH